MERSSISHKVAEGVAKLVGGVSPFLESFGNAKTVMNDNSSRFGKFMKIQFNKGRIVGGEAEHYLLEKGRLSYQGYDERNFHIFYFFLKGATTEERKRLNLKKVEDYPMLMMGNSPIIVHETKSDGTNTYDVDRMNNKLSDDPDDTGCRAALTHAKVSVKEQQNMWTIVAVVLKLGSLKFKDVNAKGVDGSVVKNMDLANEISKLMGLDHLPKEESLAQMLCIYRRKVPGNKIIDSPVNAKQAEDQKNALLKDMYSKMFDEIIKCVNRVLVPTRQPEAFVGILDIFGFEVFKKNSMEQLCINFANEKLQNLFNYNVFVKERETYRGEGLPEDVIPDFRDNTPCCNLVSGTYKKTKIVGIFTKLDDLKSQKNATDKK
jgi:myosin heavy subunit